MLREMQAAVRALAGLDTDHAQQRNDIGFSAFDGPAGHALAELPIERWGERETRRAWTLLRRYRNTQLPALGFDFDAWPEPPVPAPVPVDAWKVRRYGEPWATATIDGDRIVLAWGGADPYFRERLADVKAMDGATWNAHTKQWRVPVTIQNVRALGKLLATYPDVPFAEDDRLRERADAFLAAKLENVEASRAMATDAALHHVVAPERIRPYQHAGIAWLRQHRQTILADDMGTGKSMQTIAAIAEDEAFPALIVCPASLKLNWRREIALWTGDDDVQVLAGTKPHHLTYTRWTVINYDLLAAWQDTLAAIGWRAVAFDESAYLKEPKAARSKAAKAIVAGANPRLRFGLTGTPVLNRPVELWHQLDVIGRTDVFGSWWSYVHKYCAAKDNGWGLDVSGASNLDELNLTLRSEGVMIRRTKDDVLADLPPKQWAVVSLAMTPKERREYEQAEADLAAYVADHGGVLDRSAAALTLIATLRKLAWAAKRKAAFDWMDDFLASGRKLVVFGWHREVIEAVRDRYGCPTIMGGQDTASVEAGKQRFQTDPDCRVIACNIAAGGVGHTLTAASDVAFVELTWNDALMQQAIDRCHRIGQRDSVTGWVLRADRGDVGTIDDQMAEMIGAKGLVTRATTDGEGIDAQRAVLAAARRALAGEGGDEA